MTTAPVPGKYLPYQRIGLVDRTWPDRRVDRAPLWCSVDLRDGNQALLDPMDPERKRELFELLVRMGFHEIEVGLPASGRLDYEFVRSLARPGTVPDDVTLQVLTPARDDLIDITAEAIEGLPRVVFQVYHPVSEVQRRVVFGMDRSEVLALALRGAERAMRVRDRARGQVSLQYGPESFTQAEPEFALELCNAVLELWQPVAADDVRVNLPSTVESCTPQEFADRIEWMHRNLARRSEIKLGVHPHNDRGTGVAAAEMAVAAGADRVEGTLFGNGERSGNVCLVTLAMNLFSQGVDPRLDVSDLDGVRRAVERTTGMPVAVRHPWAGDFAYTSLAGSHQDAIAKGLRARTGNQWEVPYLPVDPRDVGRDYRSLIRLSGQSGKAGLAHLLHEARGVTLPRRLLIEFTGLVKEHLDRSGGAEMTGDRLWALFLEEYGRTTVESSTPVEIVEYSYQRLDDEVMCLCEVRDAITTTWAVGVGRREEQARRQALRAASARLARVDDAGWRGMPAHADDVQDVPRN